MSSGQDHQGTRATARPRFQPFNQCARTKSAGGQEPIEDRSTTAAGGLVVGAALSFTAGDLLPQPTDLSQPVGDRGGLLCSGQNRVQVVSRVHFQRYWEQVNRMIRLYR
jgi:hypothetical protein